LRALHTRHNPDPSRVTRISVQGRPKSNFIRPSLRFQKQNRELSLSLELECVLEVKW
jgi:hypothetical protein